MAESRTDWVLDMHDENGILACDMLTDHTRRYETNKS